MSGDRHLRPDPDGRLGGSPAELATILVKVDESCAASAAGQHLLQMLVNLLARNYGVVARILLDIPDTEVHPNVFLQPRLAGSLRSALLELGQMIGNDQVATQPASDGPQPTALILVGVDTDPAGSTIPAIAVTANGWKAIARTTEPLPRLEPSSTNPLGPHLAACVAASFAFKTAYGKHRPVDDEFNLWGPGGHDGPSLNGVELPPAYILGLGAVGAAFGFTLGCARELRGTLIGIDPQTVSDTNLNRLLTATPKNVGDEKAALFKALFAESSIDVSPFFGKWPHDYLGSPARKTPAALQDDEKAGRYRWVISCVDRNRERFDIAARLPLNVLQGSTIGMAAQTAYYSLHGPCECLGCRHRTPKQIGIEQLAEDLRSLDKAQRSSWYDGHGATYGERAAIEEYLNSPTCSGPGESDLRRLGIDQGAVDWAVGFVSVAAGIILAARFIRMAIRGVEADLTTGSEERYLFWVDELSHRHAQRVPDCRICSGSHEAQWLELWEPQRQRDTTTP